MLKKLNDLSAGCVLATSGSVRTTRDSATQSLLMLLPALLGMWLGQRLRDELSQEGFRACFMWGLLLLGTWLLWQGF